MVLSDICIYVEQDRAKMIPALVVSISLAIAGTAKTKLFYSGRPVKSPFSAIVARCTCGLGGLVPSLSILVQPRYRFINYDRGKMEPNKLRRLWNLHFNRGHKLLSKVFIYSSFILDNLSRFDCQIYMLISHLEMYLYLSDKTSFRVHFRKGSRDSYCCFACRANRTYFVSRYCAKLLRAVFTTLPNFAAKREKRKVRKRESGLFARRLIEQISFTLLMRT